MHLLETSNLLYHIYIMTIIIIMTTHIIGNSIAMAIGIPNPIQKCSKEF